MPELEHSQLQGGQMLVQLCNGVVQLLREFAGKGPSRCKAYWAGGDMLVILLGGGFTIAEQTLFDAGRGGSVRDAQHALQDTLEIRMKALVEDLTDRTVLAFMSASHQAPDFRVELFVLEPDESHPPTASDDLEPPSDDLEPASDDLEPPSDDLEPASDDLEPPSDDLEPASDDLEPASDDELDRQRSADLRRGA